MVSNDLRKLLKEHSDLLKLVCGKRHDKVVNIKTMDWIIISNSPSDWRGVLNFKCALKKLALRGEGVIYAKHGCRGSLCQE